METGYIPINIPTKKYVKAFIIAELGPNPKMKPNDMCIGAYLYDVMQYSTNERATSFQCKYYTEFIRVYIPISQFRKHGRNLNETNIKRFNLFVECLLKDRFFFFLDSMIETLPNFKANLPEMRRRFKITADQWGDSSIKQSYYRYRLKTGKAPAYTGLYKKSVP